MLIAASQQDQDQLKIENRQAHTLFGVVFLFFLGHTLRIILNLEEMKRKFMVELMSGGEANETIEWRNQTIDRNRDCESDVPYWAMVNTPPAITIMKLGTINSLKDIL